MASKEIHALFPQATLTILTKEKEKAASLCHKYGVKAEIKFVPSSELQQVLGAYKYGFIVRDDIAVKYRLIFGFYHPTINSGCFYFLYFRQGFFFTGK